MNPAVLAVVGGRPRDQFDSGNRAHKPQAEVEQHKGKSVSRDTKADQATIGAEYFDSEIRAAESPEEVVQLEATSAPGDLRIDRTAFLVMGGEPLVDCGPEIRTCEPPEEVVQLEAASASGDIKAVEAVFQSQWLEKAQVDRIHIDRFASSLVMAMTYNHVSVASYLLSVGVSMNISHFTLAMEMKSYAFLQLFLDHGWDINEPISWATPGPLMLAFNDEKLTRWLLCHGADPNAECVLDLTPLSVAVSEAPFAIIELLFNHGGSIKHGQLLHYAVRRNTSNCLEVLKFILNKGPLINNVMYQNRLDCYELQKSFGIGTPLHEAAEKGKLDMIKILLAKGADPLIEDVRGELAIERARGAGYIEVVEYLLPLSVPSSEPRHED